MMQLNSVKITQTESCVSQSQQRADTTRQKRGSNDNCKTLTPTSLAKHLAARGNGFALLMGSAGCFFFIYSFKFFQLTFGFQPQSSMSAVARLLLSSSDREF